MILGAYINAVTSTHRKNLLHLVCDGTIEQSTDNLLRSLRLFIQRGCNMNQRDDVFETPLMCTLIHRGNLILGRNNSSKKFEPILFCFGLLILAHELIVEGTYLDLKNNFGNTYLTRAVHYALYDHARMALYAGAPCRARQCTFPYTNRNYQKQQEAQTTDDTSLMKAIVEYEHFIGEFERYLLQPRQLKDIARIYIRKNVPLPLSKTMVELRNYLPSSLIDYLMLNEMKNVLNIQF